MNVTINFATKNRKEKKIMKNELYEKLTEIATLSNSRETLDKVDDELEMSKETRPIHYAYYDALHALDSQIEDCKNEAKKEISDEISCKIKRALLEIEDDFLKEYDPKAKSKDEVGMDSCVRMCTTKVAIKIIRDFETVSEDIFTGELKWDSDN